MLIVLVLIVLVLFIPTIGSGPKIHTILLKPGDNILALEAKAPCFRTLATQKTYLDNLKGHRTYQLAGGEAMCRERLHIKLAKFGLVPGRNPFFLALGHLEFKEYKRVLHSKCVLLDMMPNPYKGFQTKLGILSTFPKWTNGCDVVLATWQGYTLIGKPTTSINYDAFTTIVYHHKLWW